MNSILHIIWYSFKDQFHQKSFYMFIGASIVFLFMIKGCYQGQYSTNDIPISQAATAFYISKIGFQCISFGSILLAIFTGMSLFSSDMYSGMTLLYLSKPVSRWVYITGRIGGLWVFCMSYQFILHSVLYVFSWKSIHATIPGFFQASMLCGVGILFTVSSVAFLSLLFHSFVAGIVITGISVMSFFLDGFSLLMKNKMVTSLLSHETVSSTPLWQKAWPKISLLIFSAASLIGSQTKDLIQIVHPMINVIIYIIIFITLTLVSFRHREIQ